MKVPFWFLGLVISSVAFGQLNIPGALHQSTTQIDNSIKLAVLEARLLTITVDLVGSDTIKIYWNLDTFSTALSGQEISYFSDSSWTGEVRIEVTNPMHITGLSMTGKWHFNLQQIQRLTNLKKLKSIKSSGQSFLKDNIISGSLENLPKDIEEVDIGDFNNTVYGDISTIIFTQLERFRITGNNVVSGSINSLPSSVTYIGITGKNSLIGHIDSLSSPNISHVDIKGVNCVGGKIDGFSTTANHVLLNIDGLNKINGDIGSIDSDISFLVVLGLNKISGSINGNNSYSRIIVKGENTITGALKDLKATWIDIQGNNTLFGDISNLYPTANDIVILGNNSISTYSQSIDFGTMKRLQIESQNGMLSTSELDQLIVDLDESAIWSGVKSIVLGGSHSPRSEASDQAVISLQAKGVTVISN